MARQGRLHVPHATYFVVDRFATGLDVLAPRPGRTLDPQAHRQIDASRRRFESLLRYLLRRWCARVHAYCWLAQAALLVVRIGERPLESIMHSLRGQFSAYLHAERHCTGPAYPSRYTALLIDPEDYLLDVARHVFWSPVHAGLAKTPLGYELSSVRTCLGEPDPASLCDGTIREALKLRGQHSRHGLERFLSEAPAPGFLRLLAHGSRLDRRVLGSSVFVRETRRNAARRPPGVSFDALTEWVAARLAVDPRDIRERTRRAQFVEGRALVAWFAMCSGTATLSQVARWFGCDPSTLHRAVDRYFAAHPALFSEHAVDALMAALASGSLASRSASMGVPEPGIADASDED